LGAYDDWGLVAFRSHLEIFLRPFGQRPAIVADRRRMVIAFADVA
jgi:hypothetical protein